MNLETSLRSNSTLHEWMFICFQVVDLFPSSFCQCVCWLQLMLFYTVLFVAVVNTTHCTCLVSSHLCSRSRPLSPSGWSTPGSFHISRSGSSSCATAAKREDVTGQWQMFKSVELLRFVQKKQNPPTFNNFLFYSWSLQINFPHRILSQLFITSSSFRKLQVTFESQWSRK